MSFIIAYKDDFSSKVDGGDWKIYGEAVNLAEAESMQNQCAAEDDSRQMIAIFKKRDDWEDYRPLYLIDEREYKLIRGLEGLINSLDSSWF